MAKRKKPVKKKAKPQKKKKGKRGRPRIERVMQKYFYAAVKSALSKYFKEAKIDYSDCGTLNSITKKCYDYIKHDWERNATPPKFALENIEWIYRTVCGLNKPANRADGFTAQMTEVYKWWDIRHLYRNITCSEFFDMDIDRAYYFDREIDQEVKWLYENRTTDESHITELYNSIKRNNKLNRISPGGAFYIHSATPYKLNDNGGYDFHFFYDKNNIEEYSQFSWNSEECDDIYGKSDIDGSRYKKLKKRKQKRLEAWDKKQAELESHRPINVREEIKKRDEEISELKRKVESIQTQSQSQIEELKQQNIELKNMLSELLKRIP